MSQSRRSERKETIEFLRGKADLSEDQQTLLAVDKTIEELRAGAPRCAQAFELEIFHRMTPQKIALRLNRSEETINRDLRFARAALNRNQLGDKREAEE